MTALGCFDPARPGRLAKEAQRKDLSDYALSDDVHVAYDPYGLFVPGSLFPSQNRGLALFLVLRSGVTVRRP